MLFVWKILYMLEEKKSIFLKKEKPHCHPLLIYSSQRIKLSEFDCISLLSIKVKHTLQCNYLMEKSALKKLSNREITFYNFLVFQKHIPI